jgi:hypothetical protein
LAFFAGALLAFFFFAMTAPVHEVDTTAQQRATVARKFTSMRL